MTSFSNYKVKENDTSNENDQKPENPEEVVVGVTKVDWSTDRGIVSKRHSKSINKVANERSYIVIFYVSNATFSWFFILSCNLHETKNWIFPKLWINIVVFVSNSNDT